jgi:hypothetical protein
MVKPRVLQAVLVLVVLGLVGLVLPRVAVLEPTLAPVPVFSTP